MGELEKVRVAVESDDIVVRDPKTFERITTSGKRVPKNAYWLRRIRDRDVVVLEDAKEITPMRDERVSDDS